MKKILLLFSLALVLSSCTVTRQYYDFAHHGTDTIKANSDFKYVARNVKGKAKTTIKLSAWKKLKQEMATEGLLSMAKQKLPALKNNQAFANVSIDVLRTEQGTGFQGQVDISSITLEVVVSADIIEYIN
jgi:hypothetical protein